jgi:hypothetical protein
MGQKAAQPLLELTGLSRAKFEVGFILRVVS